MYQIKRLSLSFQRSYSFHISVRQDAEIIMQNRRIWQIPEDCTDEKNANNYII